MYKPQLSSILVALGLLLLSTCIGILKPWPIALLLDYILGDNPLPDWVGSWGKTFREQTLFLQIFLCSLSVFVIYFLTSILTSIQNYVVIRIGLKGLRQIRQRLFGWMQTLSLSYFLNQKHGDMIYRLCWDTYSFQTLFQHVWFSSAASFLSMFSMLWIMWKVNEMLTFISCVILPMLVLSIKIYGKMMNRRSVQAHKADSQVATYIQQTINSISAIQSFVLQDYTEKQFSKYNKSAWYKRLHQHTIEIIYQNSIGIIFSLGMAGIICAGANEVIAGRLSVGELIVFTNYLSQFYIPLQQLTQAGSTLADARAGVARVFEVLDTQPEIKSPPNGAMAPSSDHGLSVEFEHVNFGYTPARQIIHDLSFKIVPGEFLAIVGPNGSGKTTLVQLLSRSFDPESGSIRINGLDIRNYNLNSLRRSISYVHQEPLIIPGTVRENILFGREGATQEEMMDVARLVHIDTVIERLPNRWETHIGDGGSRLSVGEKQRLCLARAFLKNAPILILDEPTSALDAENQLYVIEALRLLAKKRTTFMIAHRMSTLAHASLILVLVDGRIQAIGSHEQLLQTSEYYRRAIDASNSSVITTID